MKQRFKKQAAAKKKSALALLLCNAMNAGENGKKERIKKKSLLPQA